MKRRIPTMLKVRCCKEYFKFPFYYGNDQTNTANSCKNTNGNTDDTDAKTFKEN
ncbi:hypothetical protein [Lacrimispora xylanisolvens]|uniref:hypothetical protein n=1 Tax=Lacrimispora xylanisolvens TaxID=384636 RepID=UPI003D9C9EA5